MDRLFESTRLRGGQGEYSVPRGGSYVGRQLAFVGGTGNAQKLAYAQEQPARQVEGSTFF